MSFAARETRDDAGLRAGSPSRDSATGLPGFAEAAPTDLARLLAGWGFPAAHAPRLLRAFYRDGNVAPSSPAHRLPDALLDRLATLYDLRPPQPVLRSASDDGTVKLLLRGHDGRTVESVLMPDHRPDRAAGCLSSQVGCAMGCDFCATARAGFERNLSPGEIVAQFIALRAEAAKAGRRLQTVVFMGMGEPLLNLDAVLEAIRRIADNALGGLGWRQVTVSTVGIIPGIDALAASGLNVQLALSLHAPDAPTRARLLPAARRHPIPDLLAAADRFQAKRRHPVIIQYCLLDGVNDSDDQARELAALLAGRRMHVNLLRYNPTGPGLRGTTYAPTPEDRAEAFASRLRAAGIVAHFRRSRGPDIAAACGQLREISGTDSTPR